MIAEWPCSEPYAPAWYSSRELQLQLHMQMQMHEQSSCCGRPSRFGVTVMLSGQRTGTMTWSPFNLHRAASSLQSPVSSRTFVKACQPHARHACLQPQLGFKTQLIQLIQLTLPLSHVVEVAFWNMRHTDQMFKLERQTDLGPFPGSTASRVGYPRCGPTLGTLWAGCRDTLKEGVWGRTSGLKSQGRRPPTCQQTPTRPDPVMHIPLG